MSAACVALAIVGVLGYAVILSVHFYRMERFLSERKRITSKRVRLEAEKAKAHEDAMPSTDTKP